MDLSINSSSLLLNTDESDGMAILYTGCRLVIYCLYTTCIPLFAINLMSTVLKSRIRTSMCAYGTRCRLSRTVFLYPPQ